MRLLDLFSGAGGAAQGYYRAGFDEIVGVDHRPMPRYPFDFVEADALEYLREHGQEFDAIHASPPCQAYSRATAWRGNRARHSDLIALVRRELQQMDVPYVIENVQEARHLLHNPFMLCGTCFQLPLRRHRFFETSSLPLMLVSPCQHRRTAYSHDHGAKQSERTYADAMGCDWMTVHEARQAIPPAYTEFLGRQILRVIS